MVIDSGLLSNTSFGQPTDLGKFSMRALLLAIYLLPQRKQHNLARLVLSSGTAEPQISAVPEPGTLALLGLVSTVGFGVTRFRKRKCKAAV